MIHLIRHAEPAICGVLLGRLDPSVAEAPQPSHLEVRSVFASPLKRALDTATSLFPLTNPTVLPDLSEISLGAWDGLTWAEIEQRDPLLASQKMHDWFGVAVPGGEDYAAILSRAAAALILIRQSPLPAAVVAHAGINAVLWQLLTGSPAVEFRQDYLEVKSHDCVR